MPGSPEGRPGAKGYADVMGAKPTAASPRVLDRDTMIRYNTRASGPVLIGLLVVAYAVVWPLEHQPSQPWAPFLGQMIGAEAVLLFAIALVLMSSTRWVESLFAGLDRAAIWHRTSAITGTVLLGVHALITSGGRETALGKPLGVVGVFGIVGLVLWAMLPRWRQIVPRLVQSPINALLVTRFGRLVDKVLNGYDLWRNIHRLLGLFVAAGIVHAVLDATVFGGNPVLRWSLIGIGAVGIAFYVYRELFARFFVQVHRYKVKSVMPIPGRDAHVITQEPQARPLDFVAGQWAIVSIETKQGWSRNPFTISSSDREGDLSFTVKALGDFSGSVQALVKPGMPAAVDGPHGRFDRRRGTSRQVWIGAGVGITPFLSWARSLDEELGAEQIDFYVTSRGRSPFADELEAIAARHPNLHLHIIDTAVDGHLEPERVLAQIPEPAGLSVFMCGPKRMTTEFRDACRRAGVSPGNIHFEYFNWR